MAFALRMQYNTAAACSLLKADSGISQGHQPALVARMAGKADGGGGALLKRTRHTPLLAWAVSGTHDAPCQGCTRCMQLEWSSASQSKLQMGCNSLHPRHYSAASQDPLACCAH